MMTIKHITEAGEEFVYPTTHINFVPAEAKCATGQQSSLWWYDSAGRAYEITEGTVYVMNGEGSTVARYNMTTVNNPTLGMIVPGTGRGIASNPARPA